MIPLRTDEPNQPTPYKASVLIAGWDRTENPFRAKIESYGCTTIHAPYDASHVPKCDIAVLAIKANSHGLTERVKKAYGQWGRPVVYAKAGFETCREQFESALAVVRSEAKPATVTVRKKDPSADATERSRMEAEQRIRAREEEEMRIAIAERPTVAPAPTVESIVREGYANRVSPDVIAVDLNRRGFKTPRGRQYQGQTVSSLAAKFKCARKGKGKPDAVGAVDRSELINKVLSSPLNAEEKVKYLERVQRGELVSLIDSGASIAGGQVRLWRTPIMEPLQGVRLALSKTEACLVVEHFDRIKMFSEAD